MPKAAYLKFFTPNDRSYERVYLNNAADVLGPVGEAWFEWIRRDDNVVMKTKSIDGRDREAIKAKALGLCAPGSRLTWDALFFAAEGRPDRASAAPLADGAVPQAQAANGKPRPSNDDARGFPDPTGIRVDRREPRAIVGMLKSVRNLEPRLVDMPLGGYELPGLILIERIEIADLISSLRSDGAATHRHCAMLGGQPHARRVIIVEGAMPPGTPSSTKAALRSYDNHAHASVKESVVRTADPEETAAEVAELIRDALRDSAPAAPQAPAQRRAATGHMASARLELSKIKGINDGKIDALFKAFGSIAGVAKATELELRQVKGIGIELAKRIFNHFPRQRL